jgi:cytidylate kinase
VSELSGVSSYLLSHSECLILSGFHNLPLTRTFVVDATEMQDTVDDNAMQFFVVGTAELVSIREYSVKRDDNIAIECISFCIVEGDDIGIVIVAEVFVVDFQDLFILTNI